MTKTTVFNRWCGLYCCRMNYEQLFIKSLSEYMRPHFRHAFVCTFVLIIAFVNLHEIHLNLNRFKKEMVIFILTFNLYF